MSRYLTVVFEIKDEEEFKPLQEQFHEKMTSNKDESWSVSAMSLGDELTRLELIETATNESIDQYHVKEILNNILSSPLQNLEGKTINDFIK